MAAVLVNGLGQPLYALGHGRLVDGGHELIAATTAGLLGYSFGTFVGPIGAAIAMDYVGPAGLYAPARWLALSFAGLKGPTPREPVTGADLVTWAVKTTALGCENLMLALRAYGYDSCPMEGMDSSHVKKILGLSGGSKVVMVIGAGKRAPNGIYGPQARLPREQFIHEV